MTRIAHCCCGSLRAEVTGEPALVAACHCIECQRRTGSPFGVGAYFPKDLVRTEGPNKVYLRGSDSGRKIECHFCPNCGSTVFWRPEFVPDLLGIAFGAFADPSMSRPTLSVWETTRHPWVTFDHELEHYGRQELIEGPVTAAIFPLSSLSSTPGTPSAFMKPRLAHGIMMDICFQKP